MSSSQTSNLASSPKPSRLRRWAIGCAGMLLLLVAAGALLISRLDEPLPEAAPSAEADALAREMMAAVNTEAWDQTGAIAWDFGGRQQHLWDRHRQLARVRWGDGEEALVNLSTQEGRAYRHGVEVEGEEAAAMVANAWAFWCNDSFWLNPIAKAFDSGTTRVLVDTGDENTRGLMVTYASGGVTPGDSYLWEIAEDGRPVHWKMWVRIIPIGGVGASWDDWIELPTGAVVASRHETALFELKLSDIQAARDLEALAATGKVSDLDPGGDPFAPLLAAAP